MTKKELETIYKLICNPSSINLGYKFAESYGLNKWDLLTLIWICFNKDRKLHLHNGFVVSKGVKVWYLRTKSYTTLGTFDNMLVQLNRELNEGFDRK